ncbi:uncharacterized protein LOC120121068 isoform X2 [Hibiscus syriacus]|uniref:uncharacterized protein LOC120121068 isoform X2 n=1 Tax=Hibiscus syriacus TaxID=106335 RepID=UPI001920CBFA|nr:uncharacterized protein LOC120121068 isoform X2 [Hibiscus syriacus]
MDSRLLFGTELFPSVMNWWLMVPWFDKPQQKWLRSVRSPLPCCLILLLLFRLSLIKMVFLCKFAAVKVTSTCRRLIRRLLAKSVRRSRQKVANSLRPLFLVANSLQKLVNW